jgi:hypothetical protein
MAEYVSPEIPQDASAIRQQMIDDLEDAVPGLEVRPASTLYYLIAIFAFLWAQLGELASQVFSTIFRYYGAKIVRVPPNDAVAAATTVTFTARDTNGPYDIPAGTEVNLRAGDGSLVAFRTSALVTIPNGSTTVTPVTVVAAVPGADGNGLSELDSVSQSFTWLASVTVLASTSGGEDAETDDEFQNRLADEFTLIGRTLVREENFEAAARGHAGVARARTIADYLPGPPADDNAPGHYTTALMDDAGAPVSSPVRAEVLADFQANSLNNLIPHLVDPAYTVVTVVFTAVATPGQDPAAVQANAEAAVLEFLDPATWALPADGGDVRGWEDHPFVRYQDVSKVLKDTDGLDHHTALTINGVADDLELDGPFGLPDPDSTATGTVTAP